MKGPSRVKKVHQLKVSFLLCSESQSLENSPECPAAGINPPEGRDDADILFHQRQNVCRGFFMCLPLQVLWVSESAGRSYWVMCSFCRAEESFGCPQKKPENIKNKQINI